MNNAVEHVRRCIEPVEQRCAFPTYIEPVQSVKPGKRVIVGPQIAVEQLPGRLTGRCDRLKNHDPRPKSLPVAAANDGRLVAFDVYLQEMNFDTQGNMTLAQLRQRHSRHRKRVGLYAEPI